MADLADEEDVSAMFADMKKTKKKKKKKKKVVTEEGKADAAAAVAGVGAEEEAVTYEYADLLTRFYEILTSSNPDLLSRKKVSLKPPQILRIGTRRTLWANFPEICRTMQREPEHVFRFYLAELGTDGSIDGNGRFVIKGTYVPKYIESLLRKYICTSHGRRVCGGGSEGASMHGVWWGLGVGCVVRTAGCSCREHEAGIQEHRAHVVDCSL